jgi:hypothetical protein
MGRSCPTGYPLRLHIHVTGWPLPLNFIIIKKITISVLTTLENINSQNAAGSGDSDQFNWYTRIRSFVSLTSASGLQQWPDVKNIPALNNRSTSSVVYGTGNQMFVPTSKFSDHLPCALFLIPVCKLPVVHEALFTFVSNRPFTCFTTDFVRLLLRWKKSVLDGVEVDGAWVCPWQWKAVEWDSRTYSWYSEDNLVA